MPRRRFRDPDPQVRDRNMLDILGAPGLSGLSRVGGLSGGSQTANLIVRGDGGDGGLGVQIEHVTLYAVSSQTIANGGGTVQFDTTAGAPTQIRGFDTLQTDLASSGAVGDIPIDRDGWVFVNLLKVDLSTDIVGTVTVTRTRGADTATVTSDQEGGEGDVPFERIYCWSGDTLTVSVDPDVQFDVNELTLDLFQIVEATNTSSSRLILAGSGDGVSVSPSETVFVDVPETAQAGDVVIGFVVNQTFTRGASPSITDGTSALTYLARTEDYAIAWKVLDGTETTINGNAATAESDSDTIRLAILLFRNHQGDPTLVDSQESATSPVSASASSVEKVVAFGRGVAGSDVVEVDGPGFAETAQQSGADPITAGYGTAGDYETSWTDGTITEGHLFLIGIN